MSSNEDLDLVKLKELEQAATKGPWRAEIYESEAWIETNESKQICLIYGDGSIYNSNSNDPKLIAAIRNAASALLEIAEKWKELEKALEIPPEQEKELVDSYLKSALKRAQTACERGVQGVQADNEILGKSIASYRAKNKQLKTDFDAVLTIEFVDEIPEQIADKAQTDRAVYDVKNQKIIIRKDESIKTLIHEIGHHTIKIHGGQFDEQEAYDDYDCEGLSLKDFVRSKDKLEFDLAAAQGEIQKLATAESQLASINVEQVEAMVQLQAENARLKEEGEKDYKDMRKFQTKYIEADQENARLTEQLKQFVAIKEASK